MTITLPTPSSIASAHTLIKPYIHHTPLLTNRTLNTLASTSQTPELLKGTPYEGQEPAKPIIRFFFKCENYQRIGAFKARGAFHALLRLVEREGEDVVRARGVVTHSSGTYAPCLCLYHVLG
jgi:threonine dehydratase